MKPSFYVFSLVAIAVALCSVGEKEASRLILGLLFLWMATFNLISSLRRPQHLADMLGSSSLTAYRALSKVMTRHPMPFMIATVTLQIAVASLLLGKGDGVQIGLVLAAVFLASLLPLGATHLPNAFILIAIALLFGTRYELSLADFVRDHIVARAGL